MFRSTILTVAGSLSWMLTSYSMLTAKISV